MSVNKVILVGRLGRDPETRYMPSGEAVTNFSIATEERWKDKSGQPQTRTEWHNITLFGKLGEIASQYLHKGGQVFIEGRIQSRKYSGKDGVERVAYDIIGNEMRMLGNSNNSHDSGGYNTAPAASNSPPPRRQASQQEPAPPPVDDIDDSIPF
ncbi:single-stranded DNA-binding protein [Snodgrassella communis]|uniref:single-stranded DNA-binding protein n=2 Tax=Snodgrassella communis TaxID=2946699 RepID=UPI000C1E7396|nr:single-stranded DNA-binding protein [Snodgrassella communis]PIT24296.1 single-stranded DNA-binding protein [Snodgrassella communis]